MTEYIFRTGKVCSSTVSKTQLNINCTQVVQYKTLVIGIIYCMGLAWLGTSANCFSPEIYDFDCTGEQRTYLAARNENVLTSFLYYIAFVVSKGFQRVLASLFSQSSSDAPSLGARELDCHFPSALKSLLHGLKLHSDIHSTQRNAFYCILFRYF